VVLVVVMGQVLEMGRTVVVIMVLADVVMIVMIVGRVIVEIVEMAAVAVLRRRCILNRL
jgi:hypothetical protein